MSTVLRSLLPDDPYGWILTSTGRRIPLLHPDPADIDIRDIAHALSNQCRYAGHTQFFYSVAEHSWHCSHLFAAAGDALWGLLHDAAEAYLGDVTSPLKRLLPEYQEIEELWMEVIAHALRLPGPPPATLKDVDTAVLLAEAGVLMAGDLGVWATTEPANIRVKCWEPERAKGEFLARWDALTRSNGSQ